MNNSEQTLSIIKPDAVERNLTEEQIYDELNMGSLGGEEASLHKQLLTKARAAIDAGIEGAVELWNKISRRGGDTKTGEGSLSSYLGVAGFSARDNKPNIDSDIEYKVMSSKGDKEYLVHMNASGSLECECPGYGFRRRCRHIDQVQSSIA